MDPDKSQNLHPPETQSRIRRKPVSNPNLHRSFTEGAAVAGTEQCPPLPPRPLRATASSNSLHPAYSQDERDAVQTLGPPPLYRTTSDIGPSPSSRSATSPSPSPSPAEQSQPESSTVQKAFGEVTHFLGGLINHPTSSTKHFTILRHSHGVVFYRGSTTSIAISIFSSAPLPPDRTFWLQSKGWTGNTGMKAKAFFRMDSDWLDLTPSLAVQANQVNPTDERAWQRDIAKFGKKAPAKIRENHHLRETSVLRIPVEAGDGYFQVVMCQGPKKKVLCSSPIFRLLSTSLSPHSIRGASLSTLPLEVGAMVMGLYAQVTVHKVTGPVVATMQSKVDKYTPSTVKQTAAGKAFTVSGIGNKIVSAAGQPTSEYEGLHALSPIDGDDPTFLEQGPVNPFPVTIPARGDRVSIDESGTKVNIKVPDPVVDRFHGYFFAWARLGHREMGNQWYQSVLSIRNINPHETARIDMSQTMRRVITIRILDGIQLPAQPNLDIRIMGFLRPDLPPPAIAMSQQQFIEARNAAAEAAMLADNCDASLTQNILDHPAWASDANVQQRSGMMQKTKGGYSSIRERGQKLLEDAPLHWIGVRSATAQMKDQHVMVNGFYIVR